MSAQSRVFALALAQGILKHGGKEDGSGGGSVLISSLLRCCCSALVHVGRLGKQVEHFSTLGDWKKTPNTQLSAKTRSAPCHATGVYSRV